MHFETSHCPIYPRQEVCNSGEDCRRNPHRVSIGDDALGHIVTHQGASGVPLWVIRGRKDTEPCLPAPCLPFLLPKGSAFRDCRVGAIPQLPCGYEMRGWLWCRSQLLDLSIIRLLTWLWLLSLSQPKSRYLNLSRENICIHCVSGVALIPPETGLMGKSPHHTLRPLD